MRTLSLSLAAGLLCAFATGASAEPLTVGDAAPPLTVSKWVKGEKFDRLEAGQTYVVEFWATWCGPCRASIPHLTKLQKDYKDKGVRFIGVSVWEQDQSKVEPFVKEMGDKMEYSVAMDDVPKDDEKAKGKMALAWMEAAEAQGIPTAFIVKDKKIAWIGHPMAMDKALEKVTSPDYDISAAAASYREEKAAEKKQLEVFTKISEKLQTGKHKEALTLIDKAVADDAKLEKQLGMTKYGLLTKTGDTEAAAEYGKRLVEGVYKDEEQALNQLAWGIVDPDRGTEASKAELKLALAAAQRANELTKGENYAILDTYAKALFDTGDARKALELQEKAVKLAPESDPGMKSRLEQYAKAVKDKAA